jgi:hypothetical protein
MRNINRALLGLIVAATPLSGALGGCSDSSDEKNTADDLSEDCSLNSDCGDPLICAFSRCHKQCAADRDCPAGQRCVTGEEDDSEEASKPGVCQLPVETECEEDRDCNGGQYCGPDQECRDGCNDDSDCNLIKDYTVCTPSNVCAKEDEVGSDGDLPPAGGGSEGGAGGASGGSGGASEPPPTEAGAGGEPSTSTGGTGTGGTSGGTGGKVTGTGGKTAEGGAPSGDDCSLEDVGNDSRDEATPYEFGTDVAGCLQSREDTDWYEFTTPEEPVQGGWLLAGLKDVGTDGGFYLNVYSAVDNAQLQQGYGYQGANGVVFIPVAAGQTFRAEVTMYSQIPPEYTFYATYTPLADEYEANNEREEAKPITVGEEVRGYSFQGYSSSTAPMNDEDWYQVDLAAGSMQVTLDQPETIGHYVYLYDETGAQKGSYTYGNPGVDVSYEWTSLDRGTYYVVVRYYTGQKAKGQATAAPEFETEPYVLTVTQD